MPVIVVGADTPIGEATINALLPRESEVRAFVSSPAVAAELRGRGVKVAFGDVSDGSHVGGAALNTFCAILIAQAAEDGRERSFADTPESVLAAWVEGVNDAKVSRTIVVWDNPPQHTIDQLVGEVVVVATSGRQLRDISNDIRRLEDAAELT